MRAKRSLVIEIILPSPTPTLTVNSLRYIFLATFYLTPKKGSLHDGSCVVDTVHLIPIGCFKKIKSSLKEIRCTEWLGRHALGNGSQELYLPRRNLRLAYLLGTCPGLVTVPMDQPATTAFSATSQIVVYSPLNGFQQGSNEHVPRTFRNGRGPRWSHIV